MFLNRIYRLGFGDKGFFHVFCQIVNFLYPSSNTNTAKLFLSILYLEKVYNKIDTFLCTCKVHFIF